MLIFIHIPKTGGTSLRSALLQSLGEPQRNWTPNGSKYISLSHQDSFPLMVNRSKGAIVAGGHIPYGLHEHIDEPCDYVTVLRHPVERVMSKYHMPAKPRDVSPEEFVKQSPRFQNLMVRQLSGLGITYEGEVTQDHWEKAVENLGNIKYWGFTRGLGKLWRRIRDDYHFPGILGHSLASSNPRKSGGQIHNKLENISDKIKKGILKYNAWDYALFESMKIARNYDS